MDACIIHRFLFIDRTTSLLDYTEAVTLWTPLDFDDAHITVAGDLNQMSDYEIIVHHVVVHRNATNKRK